MAVVTENLIYMGDNSRILPLAKGKYQSELLMGTRSFLNNDLVGNAARFRRGYASSTQSLKLRLISTGLRVIQMPCFWAARVAGKDRVKASVLTILCEKEAGEYLTHPERVRNLDEIELARDVSMEMLKRGTATELQMMLPSIFMVPEERERITGLCSTGNPYIHTTLRMNIKNFVVNLDGMRSMVNGGAITVEAGMTNTI